MDSRYSVPIKATEVHTADAYSNLRLTIEKFKVKNCYEVKINITNENPQPNGMKNAIVGFIVMTIMMII
jgi:hypothetical protein